MIVVEENHSYDSIVGNQSAPYLARLASAGTLFTNSFAVTHPSQPNYLALFSGSTQGVSGDNCPNSYAADNLGHQLRAAGYSFAGYAEDLPGVGAMTCSAGSYARKHAPWTDFTDLPAIVGQPFSAFPTDFTQLPTVSFVIPNLDNDMHDGSVAQGDSWLQSRLGSFAAWAGTHRGLLIVTWDEDDFTNRNQVVTIAVGSGVARGRDAQAITHYSVLRTLEDAFGLGPLGAAAQAVPITALGG